MRILQVSPGFHGYWRSIENGFRALGHEITTHVYDPRLSRPARIKHAFTHELPQQFGHDRSAEHAALVTARAAAAVREARPDAILLVKVDVLGEEFWEEFLRYPRVIWLYDEIRRTRHTIEDLARLGPIATYSALDHQALAAASVTSRYVPLAHDPTIVPAPSRGRQPETILVGARYPVRETLLTGLARSGVPVRAYGRDWSHHPVDRMRTWWEPARPDLPWGRDLAREETYAAMTDATAALNVHNDQDGFTMRTFEACGVGALQLIDRDDVTEFYEPDAEVAVFADVDELADLCRRAARDHEWADKLRAGGQRRTLAEHTFEHRTRLLAELF